MGKTMGVLRKEEKARNSCSQKVEKRDSQRNLHLEGGTEGKPGVYNHRDSVNPAKSCLGCDSIQQLRAASGRAQPGRAG